VSPAFDLLVEAFEPVGALEMLMVLARQPVEGEGVLDRFLDPIDELLIAGAPFGDPGGKIAASLLEIASVPGSGLRPAKGQAPSQRNSCRQSSSALRGRWSRALRRKWT